MTQSNPLEQAKKGDPQAIATLMNRSLQPKGMTATATRQGGVLEIVLSSDQVPNRQVLTTFIKNGLKNLGVTSYQVVRIVGTQTRVEKPIWVQEFQLEAPPTAPATTAPKPPVPPRPLPPPPRSAASTASPTNRRPTPPPPPRHHDHPAIPPLQPDPRQVSRNGERPHPPTPGRLPPIPPAPVRSDAPPPEPPPTETIPPVTQPPDFYLEEDAIVSEIPDEPSEQETIPVEDTTEPALPIVEDEALVPSHALSAHDRPPVSPADEAAWEAEERHRSDAEPPAEEGRASTPGGSVWGGLAVVLTSVLTFGVIGYALWASFIAPRPMPDPMVESMTDPETEPSPDAAVSPTPVPTAPADRFEEARQQALQAANLAQTAQSPQEWITVAGTWQAAIDILQTVPPASPNYTLSQQKILEYQGYQAIAQINAGNPPVVEPIPATSGDISCSPVATLPESPPVELSNLRLVQGAAGEGDFLVGCVTNHTEQAIASVALTYEGTSVQDAALAQGGFDSVDFNALPPQQTVPFRSRFTINPGITNLRLETIYWTPTEATDPQQIPASIELTR